MGLGQILLVYLIPAEILLTQIKKKIVIQNLLYCFFKRTFINNHRVTIRVRDPFTAWNVSKYRVISGPYFPVFGLNTEIYEVSLYIQSGYRKIWTSNNSVFGHFSSSDYAPNYENLHENKNRQFRQHFQEFILTYLSV